MQKVFVDFILESSLSQDADIAMLPVDDDDDNPEKDPFIPHERVFAKYAAMLYSSDNGGKTFHEFKESKFCASCGEKVNDFRLTIACSLDGSIVRVLIFQTLLCPHKILLQEQVFGLPLGSTHLKISRPKVRINVEMME